MTVSSGIDAPPDGMSPGIGHTAEIVTKVTEALSAETLGNPGINVLATPCLAGLCDEAAAKDLFKTIESLDFAIRSKDLDAATPLVADAASKADAILASF